MDENEKETLNKIAPHYFGEKMQGADQKYNEADINAILPHLKGENVLELGCGEGLWTDALLQTYRKVTVVDASDFLLNRLKKRLGDKVECYNSYFEEFETDIKFDTILAAHILEHVEQPVTVLKKASSWLSKSGQIIIVVPNAFSLHRRIGKIMGLQEREDSPSESDKFIGHRRVYSKESLLKDITLSGLKTETFGGIGLKPLSNAQMESLGNGLINAFIEVGNQIPSELRGQIFAICKRWV